MSYYIYIYNHSIWHGRNGGWPRLCRQGLGPIATPPLEAAGRAPINPAATFGGGGRLGAAGASHLMSPTHVLEASDCASSKHPLLTCKFTMWHEKTKEQCKAKALMLQVVTGCTLFQWRHQPKTLLGLPVQLACHVLEVAWKILQRHRSWHLMTATPNPQGRSQLQPQSQISCKKVKILRLVNRSSTWDRQTKGLNHPVTPWRWTVGGSVTFILLGLHLQIFAVRFLYASV